jgi:hypothetical protein
LDGNTQKLRNRIFVIFLFPDSVPIDLEIDHSDKFYGQAKLEIVIHEHEHEKLVDQTLCFATE